MFLYQMAQQATHARMQAHTRTHTLTQILRPNVFSGFYCVHLYWDILLVLPKGCVRQFQSIIGCVNELKGRVYIYLLHEAELAGLDRSWTAGWLDLRVQYSHMYLILSSAIFREEGSLLISATPLEYLHNPRGDTVLSTLVLSSLACASLIA